MQQNSLVLLQIRVYLQQHNDPERARILDGPPAPDHGGRAPDVLLRVKAHLQQINADLQHITDDRLHIEVDLQHLFERALQIMDDERPSGGDLQHPFLDLQRLTKLLQQKVLDLQQLYAKGEDLKDSKDTKDVKDKAVFVLRIGRAPCLQPPLLQQFGRALFEKAV